MTENNVSTTASAQLLTIEQAADFLGYKKKYLYNLTSAKAIPFVKYGPRRIFFRLEELQEWRNAQIVDVPSNAQIRERAETAAAQYCARHARA